MSKLIVKDPNARDEDDYIVETHEPKNPEKAAAFAKIDKANAVQTHFGREPSGEIIRVGGRLGDRGYFMEGGKVFRFRTKSNGNVNSDELGDSLELVAAFEKIRNT